MTQPIDLLTKIEAGKPFKIDGLGEYFQYDGPRKYDDINLDGSLSKSYVPAMYESMHYCNVDKITKYGMHVYSSFFGKSVRAFIPFSKIKIFGS